MGGRERGKGGRVIVVGERGGEGRGLVRGLATVRAVMLYDVVGLLKTKSILSCRCDIYKSERFTVLLIGRSGRGTIDNQNPIAIVISWE